MLIVSPIAGCWLFLAAWARLAEVGERAAIGLVVTVAFALLARWLRAVSKGGAIAGALVTWVVYVGSGAGGFVCVVVVFLLTSLATRFGYRHKQELGTAENREGRSARQVLANLSVAAAASAATLFHPSPFFTLAMAAALAEAAADTVSGEMGQALEPRAYLITNLRAVEPGTNGGISLSGTMAGCLAALVVAAACAGAYLVPLPRIVLAAGAGVLGMAFDSLLGATLERPGGLNNDAVNLLSTLFAAGCAVLIGWL